jgi:penicillin-binding protein 1C
MRDHGVLTRADAEAARRAAIPRRMRPFPQLAPHLADRMRAGDPSARRFDLTIDAGVQARMERLVREAADAEGAKLSAALIAVDHRTGDVIASVGSPGYDGLSGRQGFVDMTQAIRSPGSTLKPLIYAMAFDQGLAHPKTLIHDGPVMFGR